MHITVIRFTAHPWCVPRLHFDFRCDFFVLIAKNLRIRPVQIPAGGTTRAARKVLPCMHAMHALCMRPSCSLRSCMHLACACMHTLHSPSALHPCMHLALHRACMRITSHAVPRPPVHTLHASRTCPAPSARPARPSALSRRTPNTPRARRSTASS
jgi:hypothetical protein